MKHDAAFSDFVAARQAHLRRIAYALCGDWHRADDLLQTALTKLYVAWPRIRHEGNEEAYCRQIMVRANIDESRRPWRRERPSERKARSGPGALAPRREATTARPARRLRSGARKRGGLGTGEGRDSFAGATFAPRAWPTVKEAERLPGAE